MPRHLVQGIRTIKKGEISREREREGRPFFFKSSIHLILLFELKLKLKLDNESIQVLHVEGKKKEGKEKKGEIPLRPMKSIEMLTHR